MQILERTEIGRVRVPRVDRRVAVRHRWPVELDEARPRFDQAPGEQRALAKGRPAVPLPDLRLFLLQVEGVARLARQEQVIRLLVVFVEGVGADRLFQLRHGAVDPFEQIEPLLQPLGRNVGTQRQITQVDGLVRVLIQPVGIVGLAEESRRPALADDARLLQRTRHLDKRQHRIVQRLELGHLRARGGEIARRRRLELAGRRNLVRGIAGQHLVDRRGVIEQSHRRIAHRPDQGVLVGVLREQRHGLAQLDAVDVGLDGLEVPADV